MAGGRFVVLGLAQARSPWFRSVAQWSNSASIPVEFVKCMSAAELRAHLASGRSFSALLVDGGLPALDRDLVQEARDAGCAVLVVDDLRVSRDWRGLGASAVINPVLERKDLLDVLAEHAVEISRADAVVEEAGPAPGTRRARLAMVCGSGGTGASTVAIALAQGLADNARYGGMVLLADFALHAEQAMLHDARDVVPGVQELVDAFRTGRPTEAEIRTLTFDVQERRYHLLLGLRRSRNWPALRPRTFTAAFDGLLQSWHALVCDCDPELEGEDDTGSIDLEERNLMARTVAGHADVAFCVGLPGMKGVHALVRVIGGLLDHGVPADRIVPVVNRAPKGARSRAEMAGTVAQLLRGRGAGETLPSPIFLPERKVDEALRDMVRIPSSLTGPLVGAFDAVTRRAGSLREAEGPRAVVPGSLGHWSADVAADRA